MSLLSIHYIDEHIVIVHKPANMLVHKSKIDRHEHLFLMQELRNQLQQHVFPVHRLDKPTSGLLIFALYKEAARAMADLIESRQLHKEYLAITRGYAPEQAHIDYALKDKLDKVADRDLSQEKEAKPAITQLSLLAKCEIEQAVGRYETARYSLVKLIPVTGRKHQLRRHMAHIRHPIIGDTTHGDGKQNQFARDKLQVNGLMLSAVRLSFLHPILDNNIDVVGSAHPSMLKMMEIFEVDSNNLYSAGS